MKPFDRLMIGTIWKMIMCLWFLSIFVPSLIHITLPCTITWGVVALLRGMWLAKHMIRYIPIPPKGKVISLLSFKIAKEKAKIQRKINVVGQYRRAA